MSLWLVHLGRHGEWESLSLENYHNLPDDLQADLPLKRIWFLVNPEEE